MWDNWDSKLFSILLRIILLCPVIFIFSPNFSIWLISRPFYYVKFIELSWKIHKNPNNKMAFYNRATYRSEYGDRKGAISDYTKSIEVRSKYFSGKEASPYHKRGQEYELIGDLEKAISDYAKSAEIYKQGGNIEQYEIIFNERLELIQLKRRLNDSSF